MNKFVLGVGIASVLGVLVLTVYVWTAVVGAASEEPADLQAAEPVPVAPSPVPAPQEQRSPQAESRQDSKADAERRKRFREGMEKSRQKQEAREQESRSNAAPRNTAGSGETFTLPSGLEVTVHSYSSPVQADDDNEFWSWKPDAGKQFAVIDVEGCAGSSLGDDDAYISPSDFSLQMPDNTRVGITIPNVTEPSLPSTNLLPGECARGFVSFQVPKGQRPSYVRFSQIWPEEVARWAVD